MALAEEIIRVITEEPGLKAKKIAELLNVDKKAINGLLHGQLKGKVRQDNAYRWYPATGISQASDSVASSDSKEKVDTIGP